MKTSSFEKGIPMVPRATALVGILFIVLSAAGMGCEGGVTETDVSEGNRCNPLDSHNECQSGLVCTGQGSSPTIPFCPENYCCPVDSNGNVTGGNDFCMPGCAGGAQAICTATKDPGACAFAAGASLEAALAMDSDAAAPAPADDAAADGGGD
jgi:hypothetical protein